jgi:hypothetical protein
MTSNQTHDHSEITRLRRALTVLRARYANLLAAARAAVAAEQDGEPDPIAYLRDELPDHTPRPDLGADDPDQATGRDR